MAGLMRAILHVKLAFVLTLLCWSSSAVGGEAQATPSFDCGKAVHAFETAICNNQDLAALDVELDKLYRSSPANSPERRAHRVWNNLRDDCGSDVDCIFDLQMRSYFWMRGNPKLEPWLQEAKKKLKRRSSQSRGGGDLGWGLHLPKTEEACTRTSFAVISDRFGGDPKDPKAAGTAALLSNGGYVVTYESDKVLIDSQPGDPVEMCLASIPVDCPPGDERGRWYDITNLRTHARTRLPDAQHACGGA
jgi:uncharacterized protein YecT (DUF1311 family)